MNVLFLDIDGVLSTMESSNFEVPIYNEKSRFSKQSVDLLVEIVKEYNFVVVLSSAWRCFVESYSEVEKLLNKFSIEIFDKTPQLKFLVDREEEIKAWLQEHSQVKKFVILDDLPMFELYNNWVQTSLQKGLQPKHKKRIAQIMSKE